MQNWSGRAYVSGDEGRLTDVQAGLEKLKCVSNWTTHHPTHWHTLLSTYLSPPSVSVHFNFFIVVVLLLLLLFLVLGVVLRKGSVEIFSVFLFVWEWDVSLSFTSPTHIITCSFLLFLLCFCHLAFIHLSTAGREVFRSFTEAKAVGEEAACFTSQEGNTLILSTFILQL